MLQQADGSLIAYLTKEFELTTPEKAELVKIVYPDGSHKFVYPTRSV